MKHIGIVCEGPTDYIILKGVIDQITGDQNTYVMLQPEDDLTGKYGNGWKGVWKWCNDHASIRKELMKDIQPALDLLVVQMDGDVSRKEKSSHCWCKTTQCAHKGEWNPLACDITPAGRAACPIVLPCLEHDDSIRGYMSHLKSLLTTCSKKQMIPVLPFHVTAQKPGSLLRMIRLMESRRLKRRGNISLRMENIITAFGFPDGKNAFAYLSSLSLLSVRTGLK